MKTTDQSLQWENDSGFLLRSTAPSMTASLGRSAFVQHRRRRRIGLMASAAAPPVLGSPHVEGRVRPGKREQKNQAKKVKSNDINQKMKERRGPGLPLSTVYSPLDCVQRAVFYMLLTRCLTTVHGFYASRLRPSPIPSEKVDSVTQWRIVASPAVIGIIPDHPFTGKFRGHLGLGKLGWFSSFLWLVPESSSWLHVQVPRPIELPPSGASSLFCPGIIVFFVLNETSLPNSSQPNPQN